MAIIVEGGGLDLVAQIIQAGRDHGIPGYTEWRRWCHNATIDSFDHLQDDVPPESLEALRAVYQSVIIFTLNKDYKLLFKHDLWHQYSMAFSMRLYIKISILKITMFFFSYTIKLLNKQNILLVQPMQAFLHFFFLMQCQLSEWKSMVSCNIVSLKVLHDG